MTALSPQEHDLVSRVLNDANDSTLQPEAAIRIFAGSKLPHPTLGKIWDIVDRERKGYLLEGEVGLALRLVGWAQSGKEVTAILLDKPGPLATLSNLLGIITSPATPLLPKSTDILRPLVPENRAKYLVVFQQAEPSSGILPGPKVWQIFLKSGLPIATLSQIWELVDMQHRGDLDQCEFVVALHIIHCLMDKAILTAPETIPNWLFEQAGTFIRGRATSRSVLMQAFTTDFRAYLRETDVEALRNCTDIPPKLTVLSDCYYRQLVDQQEGLSGDVAVPFLVDSRLPPEDLERIWDIADFDKTGSLDAHKFSIALLFTFRRMVGGEIPSILPRTFIAGSGALEEHPNIDDLLRENNRLREKVGNFQALQNQVADLRAMLASRNLEIESLRRHGLSNSKEAAALAELSNVLHEKDILSEKLQLALDENSAHRTTNEILNTQLTRVKEQLRITMVDSDMMAQIFKEDVERETSALKRHIEELRVSSTTIPSTAGDEDLQNIINETLSRENSTLRLKVAELGELIRLMESSGDPGSSSRTSPSRSPFLEPPPSPSISMKKSNRRLRRRSEAEGRSTEELIVLKTRIQELEGQSARSQRDMQRRIEETERRSTSTEATLQARCDALQAENDRLRRHAPAANVTAAHDDDVAPPAYEAVL